MAMKGVRWYAYDTIEKNIYNQLVTINQPLSDLVGKKLDWIREETGDVKVLKSLVQNGAFLRASLCNPGRQGSDGLSVAKGEGKTRAFVLSQPQKLGV